MTSTKTIEINRKKIINFSSSIDISSEKIDVALQRISQYLMHRFGDLSKALKKHIEILFFLLFGSPRELWDIFLHDILNIPRSRYVRGAKQPVLHCPKCGSPGIPNGTTKSHTHQYRCSHNPAHTFTEKSSAEYLVFKYLLFLKALQLLKSGLSLSLISLILGVARADLSRVFDKIRMNHIETSMRTRVLQELQQILTTQDFALLTLDTTFAGGIAIILLKVVSGSIYMHVAKAETKRSIEATIQFLKANLDPEFHGRLIFLSDGSIHIYKAVKSLFPQATHIRQFHNGKHLGLVHIHFTYKEKRYTLVLRWDHFVPEVERMHHVRKPLNGELVLREGEFMLYEKDLVNPAASLEEEDKQRLISWCVASASALAQLDELIALDYKKFRTYGKGVFPSLIVRNINVVAKNKTLLRGDEEMCRRLNHQLITGFERLQKVDLKKYGPRYLSHIYKALKRISLCAPTSQERRTFRALKERILEIIRDRLVEARMLQVAEGERRSKTNNSRARLLFRGFPDEIPVRYQEVYEAISSRLKRFFDGKYITSNHIEGYFGRVKSLVEQHRNFVKSPKHIYLVLWRSSGSITNRMRMISELIDEFSMDYIGRDTELREGSRERIDEVEAARCGCRSILHGGMLLRRNVRYEVVYKNRRNEVKKHRIFVVRRYRRKSSIKKTWYRVVYLDTGEERTLRGDRVLQVKRI